MKIQLSCIIPTYNEPKEVLSRAILSACSSNSFISEVIVVDDGSLSEESEKAVANARLKSGIPIDLIKKPNGGPSSARNVGIQSAKYDWVQFLDADDILLPDGLGVKVEKVLKLNSARVAGVYGGFVWEHTGETQNFSYGDRAASADSIGVIGKVPGGAPAFILNRKALVEVGGFDTDLNFNEDIDLILRMMKVGWEFYGVRYPGFIRTNLPNSHTRGNKKRSLAGGRKFLYKACRKGLLSKKEIFRRYLLNLLSSIKFRMLK